MLIIIGIVVFLHLNKSHTSLDGDLLLCISLSMHFNFFQYYSRAFFDNLKARIGEETEE